MLDKLSWLHISDFHFRSDGDRFSQEVSCNALIRDVPSRVSEKFPLQFLFVTGDIAFSGRSSEYDVANRFLVSLLRKLGLNSNRLCIVPGNHDVDRKLQDYMYCGVLKTVTNQQKVDEFLGRDVDRGQLMERQSAYRKFRDCLIPSCSVSESEDGLARVRTFDLMGFRLCVLELNSAWLSGSKDRPGGLLIGERQVIGALALAEERQPHLTIALAHHPQEWLVEFDRISCTNRLVPQLDVFHCGHLHGHQASVMLIPGSQCLHSAAGSSHETRHYQNSYNLVEYDIGTAICRIRQFEYRPDSGSYQELRGMQYQLPCARDFPFAAAEIAEEFRQKVHTAKPHADYMAALLTGDLDEVPIEIDSGSVAFASKSLDAELHFQEVLEFLRMSNLMRVFGSTPLSEMVSSHLAEVSDMADLLERLSTADSEFAEALSNRIAQTRKLTGDSVSVTQTYQEQYLDALASDGEISTLIETSTRYAKSSDESVRIAAKRHLALAHLQAGDMESKGRGLEQAIKNLDESWADSSDYRLASAAAESLGDTELAEDILLKALGIWPCDLELQHSCRSLAVQIGSRALRQRLTDIGGND